MNTEINVISNKDNNKKRITYGKIYKASILSCDSDYLLIKNDENNYIIDDNRRYELVKIKPKSDDLLYKFINTISKLESNINKLL